MDGSEIGAGLSSTVYFFELSALQFRHRSCRILRLSSTVYFLELSADDAIVALAADFVLVPQSISSNCQHAP